MLIDGKAIVFILFLLLVIVYLLVRKVRKIVPFVIGVIVAVCLAGAIAIASVYIYKTVSTLNTITWENSGNTKTAEINVYVKNEDAAQSLEDAKGYTFGILKELDRDNTDSALQQIYDSIGNDVQIKEYADLTQLADSLNSGASGAIIMNHAYVDVLNEIDRYTSFSSSIREIESFHVESVVERKVPKENISVGESGVTDEIYTIYFIIVLKRTVL